MGRVARYKKVKACDPYSSKNRGRLLDADTVGVWGLGDSGRKAKKRSLTSQKLRSMRKKSGAKMTTKAEFDVAPESDDFDLADLVGSLKREKCSFEEEQLLQQRTPVAALTVARNKNVTVAAAAAALSNSKATPQSSLEEKEEQKLMNKVKQQVEPKPASLMAAEGRLPGESKRAYNKRVKLETRQIIQRSSRLEHNPEKRQKKKDFLNNKKKKNKRKRAAWDDDDADDDVPEQNGDNHRFELEGTSAGTSTTGQLLTGEQAVAARARATQVRFGEQAERPPVFAQLPRGASKKQQPPASSSSKKKEEQIEAERQAMDRMRRKVQAQYAEIKAKRKQNGDFHL